MFDVEAERLQVAFDDGQHVVGLHPFPRCSLKLLDAFVQQSLDAAALLDD